MEIKEKKKSIFKEWWLYLVIIVFAVVIYMLLPKATATGLDSFATCLTDKGAVMYGTSWCGHCKNQKEMFGNSFKKINYVDCDARSDTCLAALVTGYPTWKINGQNYPGSQSLEKLRSLAGCSLG